MSTRTSVASGLESGCMHAGPHMRRSSHVTRFCVAFLLVTAAALLSGCEPMPPSWPSTPPEPMRPAQIEPPPPAISVSISTLTGGSAAVPRESGDPFVGAQYTLTPHIEFRGLAGRTLTVSAYLNDGDTSCVWGFTTCEVGPTARDVAMDCPITVSLGLLPDTAFNSLLRTPTLEFFVVDPAAPDEYLGKASWPLSFERPPAFDRLTAIDDDASTDDASGGSEAIRLQYDLLVGGHKGESIGVSYAIETEGEDGALIPFGARTRIQGTFTPNDENRPVGLVINIPYSLFSQLPPDTVAVATLFLEYPNGTCALLGDNYVTFCAGGPGRKVSEWLKLHPPVRDKTKGIETPALAVTEASTPEALLGCDPIYPSLEVRNTGSGPASNVKVVLNLPVGLTTSDGKTVYETNVATLRAGDSSRLPPITLKAARTGKYDCKATVTADGNLKAVSNTATTVVRQPRLLIGGHAPEGMIVLGREAAFEFSVGNSGDGGCADTVVSVTMPDGALFVSADNAGSAVGNVVSWKLGTVSPGQTRTVRLSIKPICSASVMANVAGRGAAAATTTVQVKVKISP